MLDALPLPAPTGEGKHDAYGSLRLAQEPDFEATGQAKALELIIECKGNTLFIRGNSDGTAYELFGLQGKAKQEKQVLDRGIKVMDDLLELLYNHVEGPKGVFRQPLFPSFQEMLGFFR